MIEKSYRIKATLHNVWESLVNPDIIELWSGADAVMEPLPRTAFKLWNGDIFGRNIEVDEEKRLVQHWLSPKWKKPSKVIISLEKDGVFTVVHLIHDGYPEEEHDDLEQGWDDYYFGAIKRLLEKV